MAIKTQLSRLALTAIFVSQGLIAQDINELDTKEKKYSYAVGIRVGESLMQQFESQPDIDMQLLIQALNAIVSNQDTKLSSEESTTIIQERQQELAVAAEQQADRNNSEGKAYLNKNKLSSGVLETDSGLQYQVVESGDEAGTFPTASDTVVVHYHGTLIDGNVFDSSYDRGEPATFPLRAVIPGWQEVLLLMRPGDKWAVVIPSDLAYGENSAGGLIGPNQVLLFDIELLEIKKSEN